MVPQTLRILLVEDDEIDREAVHRLLGRSYDTLDASTGAEALRAVDGEELDCVLLDYRLPDVDGLALLPQLIDRGAAVVLLTGQGGQDIEIEAMRVGAHYYLEKDRLDRPSLDRAILVAREMRDLRRALTERTAEAEARAVQLRMFALALTEAEQEARRALADSLHNHLQQLITAAVMRLGRLSGRARTDEDRQLFNEIDELLRQSIEESRSLTVELSPPVLHHSGLASALGWLGEWMEEKHGLAVRVDADPDADPDSEEMKIFLFEAVRELLFNVVKHAETERAHVRMTAAEDDRIQIEVRDRGVGCDPRVFSHKRRRGRGFGIFSISERIEVFGGQARFHSEPERGFRAEIVVPRRVESEPAAEEAAPAAVAAPVAGPAEEHAGQIRILLADDHRIVRQGIASLLADEPGLVVVGEAADGAQAVERARELHPDVVVMDVNMPRMNGMEATALIRQELPDVRVIGLSVNDDERTAHAMLSAGAARYLRKDGPLDELCRAIRQIGSAANGSSVA